MPKPPPSPAALLKPPTRRIFARVRAFEIVCPACGAVSIVNWRPTRRPSRAGHSRTYDDITGSWECRECGRIWIVGLVLYPKPSARTVRAEDTIPTLDEAYELRRLRQDPGGWVAVQKHSGRTGRTNKVCTCGLVCPLHGAE